MGAKRLRTREAAGWGAGRNQVSTHLSTTGRQNDLNSRNIFRTRGNAPAMGTDA
jgi:hypothetical protein